MRFRLVVAAALAAATRLGAQTTATFLGYHTTVPGAWESRKPSSTSRLAEYAVPNIGEVVVYFFGKGQGGNVDANVTRWRGQFSTPDGSPVPESVTRDSTGAFPVTFAEFRGDYRRGLGNGSVDSVRVGQTLVAAIVETPQGTLYMQFFGPSAAVAAQKNAFVKFVKSLR